MSFGPTNVNHPEKQPGEVFFGNFTHAQFYTIGWKTKRLGFRAHDCRGIPYEGAHPVFVAESELPAEIITRLKELP